MRKITCHCEQTFSVDLAETVNLDANPELIDSIRTGSFLSCVCPSCNSVLRTELPTKIEWPSRGVTLMLLPELERLSYLSKRTDVEGSLSLVIGYPELADRVAALSSGLDPLSVETLKYHLISKARETAPNEVRVFFEKRNENGDLEFHIHGLKEGEIAVTHVPYSLYESIRSEVAAHPEEEPQSCLAVGPYISVNNILIEERPNE